MSLHESCDFPEGVMDLFFFGQGENTPRKKTRRNSVNENSSKVKRNNICKNVRKIMQNEGSRKLAPKSAKLTC